MAVWRVGRPNTGLNFPEIETRADAEMLPPHGIRMEEIPKKKPKKRPTNVVGPGDSDEAAMARLARENPEYVQV